MICWWMKRGLPNDEAARGVAEGRCEVTRTEIAALTPRERDARVAEAKGWKVLEGYTEIVSAGHAPASPPVPSERKRGDNRYHYGRVWVDADNKRMACEECGDLPEWSTDDALARELAMSLPEEKRAEFLLALTANVVEPGKVPSSYDHVWAIFAAPADATVRALLEVMGC